LARERQVQSLPRKDFASKALAQRVAVRLGQPEDCLALSNTYAPEHVILSVADPATCAAHVRSAGSVFLGHHGPETAGEYAGGTHHALPTGGYARAYSGVSVDSFVKKITFQELTADGLARLAPTLEQLSESEGLAGHGRAVRIRLGD